MWAAAVWDPFGRSRRALWIGGGQLAGKSTVRFEWALHDLRALVTGRPIIAEGWGLRPDLMARIVDSPRRIVVMVATEEFRGRQTSALPRAAELGLPVSDPARAQRNRRRRPSSNTRRSGWTSRSAAPGRRFTPGVFV